LCVLKLL